MPYPKKLSDTPVTMKMLQEFRKEIREEVRAGFKKMDARFNDQDARFNDQDARFSKIEARLSDHDARFSKIDARLSAHNARFDRVDAKLHQISSDVARVALLVEEQNSRNAIVFDAIHHMIQRKDRLEGRMDEVEKTVRSIARVKP